MLPAASDPPTVFSHRDTARLRGERRRRRNGARAVAEQQPAPAEARNEVTSLTASEQARTQRTSLKANYLNRLGGRDRVEPAGSLGLPPARGSTHHTPVYDTHRISR